MIIDCHSHIWPWGNDLSAARDFSCLGAFDAQAALPEKHLQASGPAVGVLVLGFVSRHLGVEIPNEFIREYISAYPERMYGFAGLDPQQPDCLAELQRLNEDDGFVGVALSPACQAFHPCATPAMKLYELAEHLAMPVYFMNGENWPVSAILDFAQPAALDEVARSFPDLKIVISHMGFPWIEQAIAILAKHPNVYADVAGLSQKPWQAYRSLTLAYEYGVIEKLLFASDFPCCSVKAAVEALYNLNKITLDSVLPAVPREQLRGIVERNSLSLLGLAGPAAAQTENP